MSRKLTTSEFINKAKIIHGDRYDYKDIIYLNSTTPVKIICPEHGEFWQRPNNHLNGQNCPKCASRTKSKSDFISSANIIHNNRYDYSKVDFEKITNKVCIICPEHGEFWQTANDHLRGRGCPKCAGFNMETQDFIDRAIKIHGEKYTYSKTIYKDSRNKVCIICPEHGEFWQRPSAHLAGQGCPKCADNQKIDKDEFIKRAQKIHGLKYDYSEVIYEKNYKKVKIICPLHGAFKQTPHSHLKGNGCPICEGDFLLEREVRNLLKQENIIFQEQKTFPDLKYKKNLKFDFYLPEKNIAIECQGVQHFKPVDFGGKNNAISELTTNQIRDKIKKIYCEKHGIKLLYFSHLNDIKTEEEIIKTTAELLNKIQNVANI